MAITTVILFILTIVFGFRMLYLTAKLELVVNKLKRISATDDELICVLEASESPLAKRLLAAATQADLSPASRVAARDARDVKKKKKVKGGEAALPKRQWDDFVNNLNIMTTASGKLDVLEEFAEDAEFQLSAEQCTKTLNAWSLDSDRKKARSILKNCRLQ